MQSRSVLFALILAACAEPDAMADAGAPVPGLDAAALQAFVEGRALFHRAFLPEHGLGPLFNQDRCSSCHDLPTIGGHGTEAVRKATRFEHGRCSLLEEDGGDMVQQQATPLLRATGFVVESIPRAANGTTRIVPTSLYGAGLIEAIDSAAIVRNADPDDADGDGISGRASIIDRRLARFGRKASFVDVRSFVEDALANEMGLTTAARPHELKPNGRKLPKGVDPAPDPEIDEGASDKLAMFVRLLAAPERETPPTAAAADSIDRGARIFRRIGCAACHTPSFTTGESAITALAGRRVQLYSDLLLHDLGDEMATVCTRNTTPSEWRTAPLMGLRFRQELMHDGRAQTLPRAVDAHGGEAAQSRASYHRLSHEQQKLLLRFLRSL